MIKAHHTYRGRKICSFYSGYKLRRAFQDIRSVGDLSDTGLPILMIANHFSWWDGFIQYRLNTQVYKRKFHVMMLEEQLRKNMILNKGGAFSVKKQSRDIIETLNYSMELLTQPDNLVLIFPQGKIETIYTNQFHFESGLNYLFRHHRDSIQLTFNINLIDYFSNRKPTLNVYVASCVHSPADDFLSIEKAFNKFYADCITQQANSNGHL